MSTLHLKPFFISACIALTVFGLAPGTALAATKTTAKPVYQNYTSAQLQGRILIQGESYNRLWYVNPTNSRRYYVSDSEQYQAILKLLTMTVTEAQLKNIPTVKPKVKKDSQYSGQFVSAKSGEYWYVNPGDGIRYRLDTFAQFQRAAPIIGLRVSNAILGQLSMNNEQLMFDPLFNGVAYAKRRGDLLVSGSEADRVLPLASMTKVMTAMVLLDLKPDWDAVVTVTAAHINYPKTLVGNDATSEVSLKAGDRVKLSDLWVSLLSASSNQSAIIIADTSSVGRTRFIELMNEKAKSLGLVKTKFVEPSGLSVYNLSTPAEMTILGQAVFDDHRIADSTQLVNYAFTVIAADGSSRKVGVTNRNASLLAFGTQASKTGYLTEAQRNVVLKKGRDIIVVMHALSMDQRNSIISRLLTPNSAVAYNN
jgi:D-alanyl-D-alanine endopeptidase (penicillin-binding protein 7)